MLRAQQAAKRAASCGFSQEPRFLSPGRRVRRWRSGLVAGTATLDTSTESVLTYDSFQAQYPINAAVQPQHRFHNLRSRSLINPNIKNPIGQIGTHEDVRHLFDTLRCFSSFMPERLMKVNGEASISDHSDSHRTTPSSWREAAALQGYQAPVEQSSWDHVSVATGSETAGPYFDEEDEDDGDKDEEAKLTDTLASEQEQTPKDELHVLKQEDVLSAEDEIKDDEPIRMMAPKTADADSVLNEMEKQLMNALNKHQTDLAIELFEAATVTNDVDLSMEVVYALFRKLSYEHPFHTYQLLQYILERTNTSAFKNDNSQTQVDDSTGNLDKIGTQDKQNTLNEEHLCWLYHKMCFSVRSLDPAKYRHSDMRALLSCVAAEVKQLSEPAQERCIPELVTSMVTQKSANLGYWAKHFYFKMINKMKVDLPPRYFLQLLSHSKFNRSDEIPYHEVLRFCVQGGLRPFPNVVLSSVEDMFPYTRRIKGAYVALEAVIELERQTIDLRIQHQAEVDQILDQMAEFETAGNAEELQKLQKQLGSIQEPHSYVMEIAHLECIADAAARKDFVELVLLVWDAMDVMRLEPSATLYETTILCFAKYPHLLENCLTVLKDMEQTHIPSQPFIKAFGAALRENTESLAKVDAMLESSRDLEANSIQCTPTLFNAALAAHAWRGNVRRCMDLLDAFQDNDGWAPDEASFTHALESIGKAAKRLQEAIKGKRISRSKKEELTSSYFEAAESVLRRLEASKDEDGNHIEPGSHFIRNYVEFLCTMGEVTTAGLVAQDFLEQDEGDTNQVIDNKTLWRITFALADKGRIDLARKFGASTSEILPFMEAKIENMENQFGSMDSSLDEDVGLSNNSLDGTQQRPQPF